MHASPTTSSPPINPSPQRILIIRLSALGDVVMASGLIQSLHHTYPDAEISWLTEAPAAPLLRHNPRLKQVLIWPRATWKQLWHERRWRELWAAIKAFRQSLRAQQFDLVLDAQGLLKSGICAWLTGSPSRISLMAREGSRLLMHTRLTPPPGVDRRISSEYRYLARAMGAADASFRLDLAVGAAQANKIDQLLIQWGAPSKLALLCPFTTRPQKHWFEDHWIALGQSLHRQGFLPVIVGGPSDRDAAARLQTALPFAINTAGELKLDESAALVARANVLIGVDTGLTHMGSALQVPTVALFGSTCPYDNAVSPRTRILYEKLTCSPCRRHPTCGGTFDCMRRLTVDLVLQSIEEVLSTPTSVDKPLDCPQPSAAP